MAAENSLARMVRDKLRTEHPASALAKQFATLIRAATPDLAPNVLQFLLDALAQKSTKRAHRSRRTVEAKRNT